MFARNTKDHISLKYSSTLEFKKKKDSDKSRTSLSFQDKEKEKGKEKDIEKTSEDDLSLEDKSEERSEDLFHKKINNISSIKKLEDKFIIISSVELREIIKDVIKELLPELTKSNNPVTNNNLLDIEEISS